MATRTSQIENRNFLAPVGFQFNLQRSPGTAYFCNQANIPDITLGVTEQPSYLRQIPTPGDMMDFGDLNIRFLVDEDLKNFMEIQKWMRGLGYPESVQEFRDLTKTGSRPEKSYKSEGDDIYSDGTLQILSSNMVAKFNVNFKQQNDGGISMNESYNSNVLVIQNNVKAVELLLSKGAKA